MDSVAWFYDTKGLRFLGYGGDKFMGATKVISLVTQKGGAGKSTILTNLAVAASLDKKKVAVLDADPQQTLTTWWQDREAEDIDCAIVESQDVVHLPTITERFEEYDYIFIDTPARVESVNAAAIQVADFCLLPCRPSLPDMRAQATTARIVVDQAKKGAFVVSQTPSRGSRGAETRRSLAIYGLPVADQVISYFVAYQDAYSYGLGVIEYEIEGKAAQEIKTLWKWVKKKMGKLNVS